MLEGFDIYVTITHGGRPNWLEFFFIFGIKCFFSSSFNHYHSPKRFVLEF